jgi:hypothetical protein
MYKAPMLMKSRRIESVHRKCSVLTFMVRRRVVPSVRFVTRDASRRRRSKPPCQTGRSLRWDGNTGREAAREGLGRDGRALERLPDRC